MTVSNPRPFHPVVILPANYEVYDFTEGYNPNRKMKSTFGIGRYNEIRKGMYTSELFGHEKRNIHMGIDIAAPVMTPVYAFTDGTLFVQGNNQKVGDYGPTIITEQVINGRIIYALHGHLSLTSLNMHLNGQSVKPGDIIGWIGNRTENGGWNPHLHFQLSYVKPETFDLPGVVGPKDHKWALDVFPDPQMVLGKLY
jgi:peptidoglycan LD-endopeptidase LytH